MKYSESDRQFPLHTDARIKGMDRVTAQLGAGVEPSSLFQFGLKVFMDAHMPVTHEEGDRYPLGPPRIYSAESEHGART